MKTEHEEKNKNTNISENHFILNEKKIKKIYVHHTFHE